MDFNNIPTVDLDSTDALESSVTETAAAFGKHIEQIEAGIESKRARLDADLEDRLARTNIDDRPTLRNLLQRDVEKEIAQTRRDAVEASAEHRMAMLGKLAAAEQQLEALQSLHQSAQQVLTRSNAADPKKATYMQQLALGGPAMLQTFAELAIATGDRAMASAVLVANDKLPRKQRPFASAEFAEAVVGEETSAVQQQIASLRDRIVTAKELNTVFERGTSNPTDKIARGIRQRGLAA